MKIQNMREYIKIFSIFISVNDNETELKMNEFQCIFCGEKISGKVTSLLITTNWENKDKQEDQQIFCHLKCLKDACNDSDNIYIDED